MKRLAFASIAALPLVACYAGERRASGQCPAGETCSDVTPTGLDFVGNSLINDFLFSGPRPTAVGGTQVVELETGYGQALAMPYTADDDGGIGIRVEGTSGAKVTVRGAGSRTNYLRILDTDGLLMDRKELTGAALERMELVSDDFESIPAATDVAFNIGKRNIGIALYGDVQASSGPVSERLVDTSMQLTLAGSDRMSWDTLGIEYPVGSYPLTVTAGDKPATNFDVVVVDHADTVAMLPNQPTFIATNESRSVCFQALAGARYVIGLPWTFSVDGAVETHGESSYMRNCVDVTTTKQFGTVAIEASAGGESASVSLAVGVAPREQRDPAALRVVPTAMSTAGDRAAM